MGCFVLLGSYAERDCTQLQTKMCLGFGKGKRRVGSSMSAESLMQEDASAVLCLVASCVNPSAT